jgi:aminoglycoside 6-adenylyltransferase
MNTLQEHLQTDDVIQQLVEWAEQRPEIRTMLLTSTRAVPNAPVDALSDYDVILVTPAIHAFHADRRWLTDFGEVLVAYWDPIYPEPHDALEVFGNVVQYANGLKIDFTLWPVALVQQIVAKSQLPDELDAGYRVLLDKDGLTERLPAPTYRAYLPTPPDEETFQRVVEEFFSDVPYVAKCLWRDELLPAKWCLDYDMKHLYLRQMLEWRVELDHGWSLKTGALGKGLKKHLSPERWSQLESTFAGASIEENWTALFATVRLYRQVASEVADWLGYSYPHDLDRRVEAYAEQIRANAASTRSQDGCAPESK